jgi:hypothetical protein
MLMLQMAHDEDVEDLGDLDSTLPRGHAAGGLEGGASATVRCGRGPHGDPRADWSWRRPRASPCAGG